MKLKFPLLTLLLLPVLAWAAPVPVGTARSQAERFLQAQFPSRSVNLQLVFETPRITKSLDASPEYFIFSDARGGYVIAAGDDSVPAILGYSDHGRFDATSMPENLKEWLDMWIEIITSNRRSGAAQWLEAPGTKAGGGTELETAQWSQGAPYNNKCYVIAGSHCQTGCTATAAAILMRYHKWPDKGTGTVPAYIYEDDDKNSHTVSKVSLGHTYNYNQMPLVNDGNWTSTQKDEVATLMRDLAVMFESAFGLDGTSADLQKVIPAVVKYMKYDASAVLDGKAMYESTAGWVSRLKDNIDQVGPILYSARKASEKKTGHAFILDGYDKNDYFHINWGWGGQDNGYFVIPNFDDYTKEHKALLGLKKNAGGRAPESIEMYEPGITTTETSPKTGKSFKVTFCALNSSSEIFSGELAIAKFNRNGKREEIVTQIFDVTGEKVLKVNMYRTYSDWPAKITTTIHAGDYLTLVWRSSQTPDWTPARYDHENGNISSKIALGDSVILDQAVGLVYDKSSGMLTVNFSCDADRELRDSGGKKITTGVTSSGSTMKIDATKLAPATYTLHLQRGEQVKDIQLKIGLKK